MGAYENPPLILQPNYGEIFARNAQNIMAIDKQKKKEKEAKFLASSERKTDYARRANNIKAGALTENVNDSALKLTDAFFVNEDAFAKGEINAEEYAANKAKYELVLGKLSSTGSGIMQFAKNIEGLNLSNYQPSGEVFGLIDAYKKGAVDIEVIDGEVSLKYTDPDGNIREVEESWLNDPNSWSVVEKFDSDTVTNGLADIVKKQITEQASTTIQTDDAKVTTTEQRYSAAYGTREQRMEQLYNNSIIQGLDQDELGSYYMDKIVPNISADVTNELSNILNSENYKDLSEEQKKQIQADVNAGQWSNREFKIGDKTINSAGILSELSKRQLVKEALNKVPQPKVSTATVLDQRTPEVTTMPNIGSVILNDIEAAGENAKLQQFTGKTISLGNVSGKVVGATKKSDTDFLFSVEIGTGKEKRTVPAEISVAREDGRNAMKELIRQAIAGQQGISQKAKENAIMSINSDFDKWVNSLIQNAPDNYIGPVRNIDFDGTN